MQTKSPLPPSLFLAIDALATLGRSVREIQKINKTANSDTPLAGESKLAVQCVNDSPKETITVALYQ